MLRRLLENIKGDKYIWMVLMALSVVSLLAVYSSARTLAYKYHEGNTIYYLFKHASVLVLGLSIAYLSHLVDYRYYSGIAKLLFYISIPMLIYTLFFGVEINDAKRWISIPVINLTFQTSDFAKLALIMYVSRSLSRRQDVIKSFKEAFLPVILPILLVCILIVPENLSSAALLFLTCMMIMFIGRISIKYIAATCGLGAVALGLFILVSLLSGNPGRVETWKSRSVDYIEMVKGTGTPSYQVQQANIAIAKGGLVRLAPGKSTQCNFLPHPYSDFIFATIVEEYGLSGALFIIFLYAFLLFRVIKLVKESPRAFGALMAIGLAIFIVIQAFVHMGVCVNLLPTTGLTLPFVSMGGTSIWFNGFAMGIILSVSRGIQLGKETTGTPAGGQLNRMNEELPV